ncbi:MAG TPA: AI-2E family transporter [Anaerolineaceae bacterium]|nr:AI-2E family transporter [Anaerolineaceae bacterium]
MEIQPTIQENQWTFRRIIVATLALIGVGLGFWLLFRFYKVLFILFVAIILGTVIRPIATWLNHRGFSKVGGVVAVYLLLFALLIGFLLLLFPLIFEQGSAIVEDIPDYYQELRTWVEHSPNQLIQNFSQYLPEVLPGSGIVIQSDVEMLESAGVALSYITTVFKVFFIALVTLLLSFHWTLNGKRTIESLLILFPKDKREEHSEMITAIESKIGYFIAGQGALCLVVGVMAIIGYMAIGLPNAFVLGLVAGAFEAIPMIGPTLGAIPAGVIALSVSPSLLIWVIIVTVIIQLVENNLLVPRIMSKAVGVNPFVALLAIFAFSSLFGLAGALMAIPMAAIIQLVLDRFVFHPAKPEKENVEGRDFTSRLRYETKELTKDLKSQARISKAGENVDVRQVDIVMDEIEAITTDLDLLLSQIPEAGSRG